MSVYVMSDIHGLYDRYMKMLEKISLKEEDTLFILGDVIDRGNDGIPILLDMMQRENVIPFLGNHEWMMLAYLEGLRTQYSWLSDYSGGAVTLRQFSELDEERQNAIYEYLRYETALVRMIEVGGKEYMLSHAGFTYEREDWDTGSLNDLNVCCDLVFGSGPFSILNIPSLPAESPLTYIVGHLETGRLAGGTPGRVYAKNFSNGMSLIDIDTGCEYGEEGVLSCLCLDRKQIYRL
ncbi:MAG: metallophosphoesterase [Erysipelotrichaceae bacterium]|nr:metallophosphoesterase [Erysipelotrichaceae bacterium]